MQINAVVDLGSKRNSCTSEKQARRSKTKERSKKYLSNVSIQAVTTSNIRAMHRPLHIFATLLCLLTLLVGTATCMNVVQPKQSSCNHCPKQSPLSQDLPSCCSAQQQQPSAIISTEGQQPVQLFAAYVSVSPHKIASPLAPSAIRATAPPPVPPRIALRI
jgi:hypothetical protein